MASSQSSVTHPVVNPTLPDPEEILDDLKGIFASGRVTMGKHVQALEEEVSEYVDVKHAVAMSSGTSGLMLLLHALGLPKGSEVITPSFTFAATAHALLWNGLQPVFCDNEARSFTMDASAAEKLITERTSAIYPVCVFGVPGDMDAYRRLAEKYNLALIFDSAQGLGSRFKGKAVGGFGNGEVFSMSPTKVVTAMEGGLVTTNDDALAHQLRQMRDYGKAPDGEDMIWRGLSARMTEVNALIARWSLARIDKWIANRTAVMNLYQERLSQYPGVSFQCIPPECLSCRNYIVILLDPAICRVNRDQLYDWLKAKSVQTKRYFYPALHNQTLYKQLEPNTPSRLPVSERIASQSLALPMYSHMKSDEVNIICDYIDECFYQAGVILE